MEKYSDIRSDSNYVNQTSTISILVNLNKLHNSPGSEKYLYFFFLRISVQYKMQVVLWAVLFRSTCKQYFEPFLLNYKIFSFVVI